MNAEAAAGILFARNRADTMRKLNQGLGRGIRTETDQVTVWIADPRFPLPAAVVMDPRRMLTQGPASRNIDLTNIIPPRFVDAYEAAKIVSVEHVGTAVA